VSDVELPADPTDPIEQLRLWYAEAEAAIANADVVALATSGADAVPSVRMVNFKGWRGDCLSFFTNYESRKGRELTANPHATLLFYWATLKRQVQVEGDCQRMATTDSQEYFATRDREVQLSTLMSQQSREVESFEYMEQRVDELREEYRGREIPCPTYWGGMLLYPRRIEFRVGREHRRHYRWEFVRSGQVWVERKLYP
jgi:pyridoxamine 5'-phosphate oxidase